MGGAESRNYCRKTHLCGKSRHKLLQDISICWEFGDTNYCEVMVPSREGQEQITVGKTPSYVRLPQTQTTAEKISPLQESHFVLLQMLAVWKSRAWGVGSMGGGMVGSSTQEGKFSPV